MSTAVRRRPWSAWLMLLVLGALLLVPATGWIVAYQLRGLFAPFPWVIPTLRGLGIKEVAVPVYGSRDPGREVDAAAAGAPGDAGIQIARAGWIAEPSACMAATRAVAQRFPNDPVVRAAVLRAASRVEPHLWRGDVKILDPPPPPAPKGAMAYIGGGPTEEPPSPHALGAFLANCDAGERAEPDNAFYPSMRTAGLFAAHRDKEALAALHRAASLPRYDDHRLEALDGSTRLADRMAGWTGALPRFGAMLSVLFSQHRNMQVSAGVATALAVQEELAGRRERGLTIRRDVMQLGALVRTQSRSLYGSMTGAGMAWEALRRPGGAPAVIVGPGEEREQTAREASVAAYCHYLVRIGHGDEAPRVRGMMAANDEVRQLARANGDDEAMQGLFLPVAGWWMGCLLLLSNALWMLLLGGWAALAGRGRRLREGRKLTWLGWLTAPFALALLGLAVYGQGLGGQGIGVFVYGTAFPVHMCMGWSPRPWAAEFALATGIWPVLCVLFPLASALVFSAVSLWSRVPLTVGLARGFRGMALPVTCFLVLLYGGAAIATARAEAHANAAMTAYTRHTGRYVAARYGCEWPGIVAGEHDGAIPSRAAGESGGCH